MTFQPISYTAADLVTGEYEHFGGPELHRTRAELVNAYKGAQCADEISWFVTEYSGQIATATTTYEDYVRDRYDGVELAAEALEGPDLLNTGLGFVIKSERRRRLELAEDQFAAAPQNLRHRRGLQPKANRVYRRGFLDTLAQEEGVARRVNRTALLDSLTDDELMGYKPGRMPNTQANVPKAVASVVRPQVRGEGFAYTIATDRLYIPRRRIF